MSDNPDKPPHQNPALPDFWDHRYRNRVTPWDQGGVPAALRAFAESRKDRPRTLVPGCGSAYEACYLAERGWDVTALDYSQAAIDAARATLGTHAHCLLLADFFDFEFGEPYQLIYERAFMCSMPRRLWPDYAQRCGDLLVPGGLLAGMFFFSEEPKGPPFGIGMDALRDLLDPCFVLEADTPAKDSIPVFSGRERWQVWRRRG